MPPKQTACEILAAMARLYGRSLKLTLDILRHSPLPDEKALAKTLEGRAAILNKIKRLESGLRTRKENNEFYLMGVPSPDQQRAGALLNDIKTRIGTLIEADLELKARLEKELAETSGQLDRVRKGRKALKAYSPYRSGISYYISKRG